jgi:hypothetical protein
MRRPSSHAYSAWQGPEEATHELLLNGVFFFVSLAVMIVVAGIGAH